MPLTIETVQPHYVPLPHTLLEMVVAFCASNNGKEEMRFTSFACPIWDSL